MYLSTPKCLNCTGEVVFNWSINIALTNQHFYAPRHSKNGGGALSSALHKPRRSAISPATKAFATGYFLQILEKNNAK